MSGCHVMWPHNAKREVGPQIRFSPGLGNEAAHPEAGKLIMLHLRFLAPFLRCTEDADRRVKRAVPYSVQHGLLHLTAFCQASLGQAILFVICGSESCCRPQTTASRRFHEASFTLQTVPDEPSVLLVKPAHVNTVLQTTSVHMGGGFPPFPVWGAQVPLIQYVGEG